MIHNIFKAWYQYRAQGLVVLMCEAKQPCLSEQPPQPSDDNSDPPIIFSAVYIFSRPPRGAR